MSAGAASIVYVTYRQEPAFDWFADSLAAQLCAADDVELVLVDGCYSDERGRRWAGAVGDTSPSAMCDPSPHRTTARTA